MELLTLVSAATLAVASPILLPLLLIPTLFRGIMQLRSLSLSAQGRAVLITGCDSGFGKLLAERLYKEGAIVFAGCLTTEGCRQLALSCPDKARMKSFEIDITKEDTIQKAREFVEAELKNVPEGLWGLVNNAGLSRGSYVEFTSMKTYEFVMNVNFFGHVRVTQVFLPLLRRGTQGGRIINVASVAGRIASRGMSAYSSSKFAMEAFSDSLRREVARFGIRVSIIEPWFCATEIVKSVQDHAITAYNETPKEVTEAYGGKEDLESMLARMSRLPAIAEDPQRVVVGMMKALFSRYPLARYSATVFGSLVGIPLSWFAAEVQDFLFGRAAAQRQ